MSNSSSSGKLSLSERKHWGGDIWRVPNADEIHHSAKSSNGIIIPSIFHGQTLLTESVHDILRCIAVYLVASLPFTVAGTGTTSNNAIIIEPLINVCFLIFLCISPLRGVPERLVSRSAWDPEWLEDDVPCGAGAGGSHHLPVWPRLWPGWTGDPHLSARPLLELTAPVLWKESVPPSCLHRNCVCVCGHALSLLLLIIYSRSY